MSIRIDAHTLRDTGLASTAAPERTSGPDARGFADRLDRALGENGSQLTAVERGRVLAESLSLQMLQTTMALAGEGAEAPAAPGLGGAAIQSLVKSYLANQAPTHETPAATPQAPSGQLAELAVAGAPAAPVAASSRQDTAWLDPIINRAAGRYGVDGALIKAVIKAESDFNPRAVSHAGARGLMQLMPATARSLGVGDAFDPEQNVMGGTRFLADLLKRYNGDLDAALAAYNWGPGNVDRRPERMPRETREYLARVKQNYASFSA